ncbi:MAG: biopolymer transporter ExbD [Elusimicrobia bacterium]|jgi:biopolymer transport protein ExbD|nr:biopolymer transporter ExbD [Elusimicrobiota bacterium]MBK7207686.1 biopolymer transporter ExbD [Elusimicrobiota bacterium]MBK8126110.1 biopolymer transporter ExbD [Elusimicrobiota bacterium]MBK8422585.1 biopolymer transporter ExbD [Elusimicrobiota bacterium]MBK9056666.1 biopolymer transporter ExbD [Elusimicrobiota bacterium]
MGASTDDTNGLITGINVTPLVDVVLVLLIIFMATAPLIARRAVAINVPRAATGERATAALRVSYAADRTLLLEKTAFTLVTLAAELKSRRQLEPELNLAVAADAGLPYEAVMELLDTIRGAGVKKVALEVASKPTRAR